MSKKKKVGECIGKCRWKLIAEHNTKTAVIKKFRCEGCGVTTELVKYKPTKLRKYFR